MMGKYLNGYTPAGSSTACRASCRRAGRPGRWPATGYGGFNYNLLVKRPGDAGRVVHYGNRAAGLLADVISRRGQRLHRESRSRPACRSCSSSRRSRRTRPFTPAPRDADRFPNARAPRGPLFNAPQLAAAPVWLSSEPLTRQEIAELDRDFRKRAQSVQAIDKLIGDIRTKLRRLGVAHNTYVVFTSDNGFHMGERRLLEGKQTYWDHDIRVPLVVVGPGVPPARRLPTWPRTSTCGRRSRSSRARRSGRASRAAASAASCAGRRSRTGATSR